MKISPVKFKVPDVKAAVVACDKVMVDVPVAATTVPVGIPVPDTDMPTTTPIIDDTPVTDVDPDVALPVMASGPAKQCAPFSSSALADVHMLVVAIIRFL